MATFRPFAALRPPSNLAEQVSCPPYDVMNHDEACRMAEGNASSFLHVCRSDIDTSEEEIHEPKTYAKARENLERFVQNGTLVRDPSPCYYIYRQIMNGRVQTGIVGCASVDEYLNGTIKRHELTRKEKELDRIMHFDACSAQTEPVFLAFRKHAGIDRTVREWIKFHKPACDFRTEDGVTHIVWPVDDSSAIHALRQGFAELDALYIADGHHRTASSAAVSAKRREKHPNRTGEEEFNYLMAVAFCDEDLFIMDYNRVVRDLGGLTPQSFLERIGRSFRVTDAPAGAPCPPRRKHEFGMYLEGRWYFLEARPGTFPETDPIAGLDCSILQNNLLGPVLGIDDPRTSDRIDFIGGIRGLEELERRCHEGMAAAFSLYPVTMDDLFRVADDNKIMPPKSTWFEPKLRSGLFIHTIER
ncbi:MAG: DUF1015 family protein [Akkermansiaceae bacterium]|nr:DUF1015 family protein [Akkermansiaceae bacterium]